MILLFYEIRTSYYTFTSSWKTTYHCSNDNLLNLMYQILIIWRHIFKKINKYDIVAAIHNICSFMSLKLADSKFVCHAASFHNHFSFSVHLNIILGFWILFILWACNNLALIINQLSSSIIKNKWHLSTIITLLTHGANAQVKVQVLIT